MSARRRIAKRDQRQAALRVARKMAAKIGPDGRHVWTVRECLRRIRKNRVNYARRTPPEFFPPPAVTDELRSLWNFDSIKKDLASLLARVNP